MTVTGADFANYWKDDYTPLRAAGDTINAALRADEQGADLYQVIGSGTNNTAGPSSSHLYTTTTTHDRAHSHGLVSVTTPGGSHKPSLLSSPSSSSLLPPVPQQHRPLIHRKTTPLPPALATQLSTVRHHSAMGLFKNDDDDDSTPNANLAWMSVDHTLYLWSHVSHHSFCSFCVPEGQCVVSVGLVRPKAGVFKSTVEWCLVVTTSTEVFLCAVVHAVEADSSSSQGFMEHGNVRLQLVPTTFSLPTDNVRMLSVTGTKSGRIFLGGSDGCLYEMVYDLEKDAFLQQPPSIDQRLDKFYDGDLNLPDVLTDTHHASTLSLVASVGKRALSTTWNLMDSDDSHGRARKCRKLNCTSRVPPVIKAIVPDFLIRGTSFLFGGKTSTGGGQIIQMVVDEFRNHLYTLSTSGWICTFDIRNDIRLASVFDGPRTAELYLGAVCRRQSFPPTSHSSTIGTIVFPGGSMSAQAGVGGMDGARAILKLSDKRSKARSPHQILKPSSIHLVKPTESTRLTLLAVTEGGLRLYLSALAPNVIGNGPNRSNGTAGRFGGRSHNPLTPHSRMTLCHIRAPPPTDRTQETLADCGVSGALLPRVSDEKVDVVEAACYKHGLFISALNSNDASNKRNTSGIEKNSKQFTGDSIVATCLDFAARKVDTPVQSVSNGTTAPVYTKDQRIKFGGITETVSFPMVAAQGGNSLSAKLHGGKVWAISDVSVKNSTILKLSANSTTPSDSELGIGLPPAYIPPQRSQTRRGTTKGNVNFGRNPPSSSAMVSAASSAGKTFASISFKLITDLFLSRPFSHGLEYIDPIDHNRVGNPGMVPSYRISKRNAASGYSVTAGETILPNRSTSSSASPTSRNSRSARLRSWLLRPPTVPLSHLSTQLFAETKEIVALNAGGLHYFSFDSVLSSLASSLNDACDNVAHDARITDFFESYGFKEGCCMCIALAIGCGPQGNSSFNERTRSLAISAALARAFIPKLEKQSVNAGTIVSGASSTSDPLVPHGYNFTASALYDGLTQLLSRLLRPVWHKAAVVVTEGRRISMPGSAAVGYTPVKVEIILDESTLEDMSNLLRNLTTLMKKVFSRAIQSIPGAAQQQGSMMDVDETSGDQFLTRSLHYSSQMRNGQGLLTSELSAADAKNTAQLLEEKNIHSLYRLVSRAYQLIQLISLLKRAHIMGELCEVEWGLLHGLTVSQLVQTAEGQDRLESLLNSLVTTSSSLGSKRVATIQADQLAQRFADQCYLFFSPGSRFAYLGLQKTNEALALPRTSSSRISLVNQAAQQFRLAAHQWYSAPLITGRILRTQGMESFDDIANLALESGSPLAKAVEMLVELEDVASAVEICLITASNFSENSMVATNAAKQYLSSRKYELGWEQSLYHRRREDPISSGKRSSFESSSKDNSSSQIIACGTEVTPQDAVDTSYALIFYHLSKLLVTSVPLANIMVSACAAASTASFLEAFFNFLLETKNANTLLRIDSPVVNNWLCEKQDPDLLWRYYNVHSRHFEAGRVALTQANDPTTSLALAQRIEWLSRSVNSLNSAAGENSRELPDIDSDLNQNLKEATDALHVARLQNTILGYIDTSEPEEITADLREKLARSLVPVSELYNDYAAALSMFEECLLILHACRKDEGRTIQILWKNVMCEELLPCATRDRATFEFLENFVSDVGLADQIQFLSSSAQTTSRPLFEDGRWEKPLVNRVLDLGKRVYGTGADFVLPITFILVNLQQLGQVVPHLLSPGWPLLSLAHIGIPFLKILDSYEDVAKRNDRVSLSRVGDFDNSEEARQIGAILELLGLWTTLAETNARAAGAGNKALKELRDAMSSGRLTTYLGSIKRKVESPTAPTTANELLQSLEGRMWSLA